MAKKKAKPSAKVVIQHPENVIYESGNLTYIHRDGPKTAKFKAYFAEDPEGCYGFGDTKNGVRAMLYDYSDFNEED